MKKILIVDDQPDIRETVSDILKGAGYVTEEAASSEEALKAIFDMEIDVALIDLMLPRRNGMDILADIRRMSPKTRVIIMTAFASVSYAIEAMKRGAADFLVKPFRIEEVLSCVYIALEEARFEEGMKKLAIDSTFSALSNPVRRKILKLLDERASMRLMEITRELKIEDHTKVVFHLKLLKDSEILEQRGNKSYAMKPEGRKILECLRIFENYLSSGG